MRRKGYCDTVICTETFILALTLKQFKQNKCFGGKLPQSHLLPSAATPQKSEEPPALHQSGGAEDGLWLALNLGRCSGRRLSCGAGPSAPEAPHPVPSVCLTSGQSHLAGSWGTRLYLQQRPRRHCSWWKRTCEPSPSSTLSLQPCFVC